MQNKTISINSTEQTVDIIDYEFEISGENYSELDYSVLAGLHKRSHEIAISVDRVLMKSFWEIITLKNLRLKIKEKLNFIDLVKIKLDFGEKSSKSTLFSISASHNISNELFGWVYYNDDKENLQTFRFIVNIESGGIKYLD